MNETLKGVAHIGAELAAAKAHLQREMERHRKTWRQLEQVTGLLNLVAKRVRESGGVDRIILERIEATLSQQVEPKCCTPTEEELRLLNSGEYRPEELWGGSAPTCPKCAEPAPAQDEREAFEAWYERTFGARAFARNVDHSYQEPETEMLWAGWQARAARPAQTEQPIYLYRRKGQDAFATCDEDRFEELSTHHLFETKLAYAAPIAQIEQQPVAIPEAVRAWMMDVPLPDNEYGYRLTNRRDELLAAPIAQAAPQVPERLPVEPYQTVDRSSTNYKAGWNACRKVMLEGQAAPQPEQSGLVDALTQLLCWAEKQVCTHEETHRGGAIWEICDSCGAKWADDEGGRPAFVWPKAISNASAALSAVTAERDRLRDALRPFSAFEAVRSQQGGCTPKQGTVWAVASQGEDAEITVEHLQEAVAAMAAKEA